MSASIFRITSISSSPSSSAMRRSAGTLNEIVRPSDLAALQIDGDERLGGALQCSAERCAICGVERDRQKPF
jgi:hypothetical protein